MPQETNLNVYPYFDDYGAKDFHKVLFKPGYPVQARELTTLQSILQSQLERFGSSIFTDGSRVLGGQLTYNNNLDYVILEDQYFGVDVGVYLNFLIGEVIVGRSTGVRAEIQSFINKRESYLNKTTIYVKYLSPGTDDAKSEKFIDGEVLEVENNAPSNGEGPLIVDGVQRFLTSGEGFALTTDVDSTGNASAASIESGVFFVRGYFIKVGSSRILLDQYKNIGNFKIGLRIRESIVNSDEDSTLNDNSNGFSNFAAPGADRFIVSASLDKIDLNEIETNDFITISEIREGEEITSNNLTKYSELATEFARRTFDESGNYYVKSPNLSIRETLNNLKGNNGVFLEGRDTYNGNKPSEDLGTYIISPTKAYVMGYEIKTIGSTYLDFKKPRTTKSLQNQNINYYTGPTYTLNRVYGSPKVGFSTYYVSLHLDRVGANQTEKSGKEIGLARVYDFALESGSYDTLNPDSNEWDIALYDIQTYTEISLNEPITLSTPTYIKGNSSGAVGFLRYDVSNSGIITAYNVSGKFVIGETFEFDGIDNSRISTSINSYGSSDVKSVYGIVGSAYTFTADVKQSSAFDVGFVSIGGESGGISTVFSADFTFNSSVKPGQIVAYTNPGNQVPTFSKVVTVSPNSLSIAGIQTVSGVCDGSLPAATINPSDFRILKSAYQRSEDNTLYTKLPKANISSVDLSNSDLIVRKQYDVIVSGGSLTQPAGDDLVFLPFDEERYCLVNENGVTEELTLDKVDTTGSSTITISGLSNNGNAKLIATLRKTNIKEKVKNRNKVNSIVVDKSKYASSGIGSTTLNDGLLFGNYAYGTRVQDEDICLNVPDVNKILGVYESSSIANPEIPSIVLSTIDGSTGTTTDLILGEEFVGMDSNSIGVLAEKVSNLKVGYAKLSSNSFIPGEVIKFKESGVNAVISTVDSGDNDITSNFVLNSQQRNTIYDYSKIVRKSSKKEPAKKIKVLFESSRFLDSDSGDITTRNSYNQFSYCNIQKINGIRNTDIIDIRPRVPSYTVSENTRSPFEFLGRSISEDKNSSKHILASDESFAINYSYYLPRIDKIYLSKDGKFQLSTGDASENPQPPQPIQNSIEVARIDLPSYLCDIKDAKITLTDYKRYQMSDIKKLEDRIKNLEYYTSLSILETNTANLQITDADGLNRFKSGFFVDDFSTTNTQKKTLGSKNSIDISNAQLRPSHYSTEIDLLIGSNSLSGIGSSPDPTVDSQFVNDLIGSNVVRTGQLLTLSYQEVPEIIQPYSSQLTNVSAYSSSFFGGTLKLFPSSDIWVDQIRIEPKTVNVEGDYVKTELELEDEGYDQQSGFSPTVWNSWETVWTGETVKKSSEEVTLGNQVIREDYEQVTKTGISKRTGTKKIVKEVFDSTSFGDQVLESKVIPYLRSRNIEFTGRRLKPFTQVYSFFDGIDVSKFIVPKLIRVTMLEGTFQVGENIVSYSGNGASLSDVKLNSSARTCGSVLKFSARVAKKNHKFGPYNNPTQVFDKNPYERSSSLTDSYTSTSTVINIDTYSLANNSEGTYYSKPNVGAILVGRTSGATARIESLDLFTDQLGDVLGCLWIPNPNVGVNPKFEAGTKVFRLTSSSTNSLLGGSISCSAEGQYYSEGKVNTLQENIIITRNSTVDIEGAEETQEATEVGPNELVNSTVISTIAPETPAYIPPTTITLPPVTTSGSYPTSTPQPPIVIVDVIDPGPTQVTVINGQGPRLGAIGANRGNELISLTGYTGGKFKQGMSFEDGLSLYNNIIKDFPEFKDQYIWFIGDPPSSLTSNKGNASSSSSPSFTPILTVQGVGSVSSSNETGIVANTGGGSGGGSGGSGGGSGGGGGNNNKDRERRRDRDNRNNKNNLTVKFEGAKGGVINLL